MLLRHPGRVYTRGQILSTLWPDDRAVEDRAVDVHIARLRDKMGRLGPAGRDGARPRVPAQRLAMNYLKRFSLLFLGVGALFSVGGRLEGWAAWAVRLGSVALGARPRHVVGRSDPWRDLTRAVQRIQDDDYGARLDDVTPGDLRKPATAFNAMADGLATLRRLAEERERRFQAVLAAERTGHHPHGPRGAHPPRGPRHAQALPPLPGGRHARLARPARALPARGGVAGGPPSPGRPRSPSPRAGRGRVFGRGSSPSRTAASWSSWTR